MHSESRITLRSILAAGPAYLMGKFPENSENIREFF
jgi:hypothetical protein